MTAVPISPVEQVRGVARAVRFHGPARFSWFGRLSPRLPVAVSRALDAEQVRTALAEGLTDCLYREFYSRGFAGSSADRDPPNAVDGFSSIDRLSAANLGSGCWTDGWRVESDGGDRTLRLSR